MNFSRRSFAKLLATAPLVGRQASQVGRHLMMGGGVPPSSRPPGGYSFGGEAAQSAQLANPAAPRQSLMPEWQAARLAKKVPQLFEIMRDEAARNARYIHYIDPDIDVHRSISLAAKIFYQRQRNIARELDHIGEEPSWHRASKIGEFIRKTVWGD